MDNLNRFNDQLYDFFSQLSYLYPDDQDISSFKKKIYMGKIVNTRGLYQTTCCYRVHGKSIRPNA